MLAMLLHKWENQIKRTLQTGKGFYKRDTVQTLHKLLYFIRSVRSRHIKRAYIIWCMLPDDVHVPYDIRMHVLDRYERKYPK